MGSQMALLVGAALGLVVAAAVSSAIVRAFRTVPLFQMVRIRGDELFVFESDRRLHPEEIEAVKSAVDETIGKKWPRTTSLIVHAGMRLRIMAPEDGGRP